MTDRNRLDMMAPQTRTETKRRLMIVAQANDTYEDPTYGTLRTMSHTGGAEVTDENIAQYREHAAEMAQRMGDDWTVKVAIMTETTTYTTTYEEI